MAGHNSRGSVVWVRFHAYKNGQEAGECEMRTKLVNAEKISRGLIIKLLLLLHLRCGYGLSMFSLFCFSNSEIFRQSITQHAAVYLIICTKTSPLDANFKQQSSDNETRTALKIWFAFCIFLCDANDGGTTSSC